MTPAIPPRLFYPEPLFMHDTARCRCCGCHDLDACVDEDSDMACWWVEPDLCSACAAELAAGLDPEMAGLYAGDGE